MAFDPDSKDKPSQSRVGFWTKLISGLTAASLLLGATGEGIQQFREMDQIAALQQQTAHLQAMQDTDERVSADNEKRRDQFDQMLFHTRFDQPHIPGEACRCVKRARALSAQLTSTIYCQHGERCDVGAVEACENELSGYACGP